MMHLCTMVGNPQAEKSGSEYEKDVLWNGSLSPVTHPWAFKRAPAEFLPCDLFCIQGSSESLSAFYQSHTNWRKDGTQETRSSKSYFLSTCHRHAIDTHQRLASQQIRTALTTTPPLAHSAWLAMVTTNKAKKTVLEKILIPDFPSQ